MASVPAYTARQQVSEWRLCVNWAVATHRINSGKNLAHELIPQEIPMNPGVLEHGDTKSLRH